MSVLVDGLFKYAQLCMHMCVYSCLYMWMWCSYLLVFMHMWMHWCLCIWMYYSCLCSCAYICVLLMSVLFIFAQVWVHMYVCGQKGWRINSSSVILRKTTSFGTRSFFGLSLLIKIHQTVDELQQFFCLYSLGIPSTYHHTGHFYMVFGDQTQLFILERQGFY